MNDHLNEEITEEEMLQVLFSFRRGKSPRLDGLHIEFYIGFYDLIKGNLLKVVKESRHYWKFLGDLNIMFLTLIPKNQHMSSPEDYRPIACCNVKYKLILKMIT